MEKIKKKEGLLHILMNKIFYTLSATFVASFLSLSSSNAFAQTDLTIWCWDENFNVKAAQMAAEKYKEKHQDVNIHIQNLDQDEIIEKIDIALKTRNYSAMPDIFLLEDYSFLQFMHDYPDVAKDLSNDIDYSQFVDYKVASSSYKNKTYGVPFDSGVTALFVRIDLFEKAGYKFKDFEGITWDQFIQMGKKVKELTNVPLMPYSPSGMSELRILLQSVGSWYTDNNDINHVTIKNNPAMLESFKIFKKLQDNKLLVPFPSWSSSASNLNQNKFAAVLSACWLVSTFESNPDEKGKWRVVNIPRLDSVEGASQYSNEGGSQWYVNNYSPKANEAVKFLKETFASDHELINDLVSAIGLISTMKDIENLPNYQKGNPYFSKELVFQRFITWSEFVPSVNYGRHTVTIEKELNPYLARYLKGENLGALLNEAQTNIQNKIDHQDDTNEELIDNKANH